MTHVFFFRGLSTYGHDHAKWSIFDLGPVYKHFAREFTKQGIDFRPVTGLGSGSLQDITTRALNFLAQDPVWKSGEPVHLLGHSAGGLIARMTLAAIDPKNVSSLLTIATPHRGSRLARLCVEMPEQQRRSAVFLKSCGYDVSAKKHFFEGLTVESVARALADLPPPPVRHASIVCASPIEAWCWPLRLFYFIEAFRRFDDLSDGVVEKHSQSFGEVIAELPIDHFRQAGFFRKGRQFEDMCGIAVDYFKSVKPFGES